MRALRSRRSRGVTLVELMIVVTLMGILTAAMATLIVTAQRTYGSLEAQTGIKTASQLALNRIMSALTQSKRLFQNNANDLTFLTAAHFVGAPALLANSLLPTIEDGGSISPTLPSFVQAAVGNELFFLSADAPVDMVVNNASVSTQAVRADSYHFNYYFLGEDSTRGIGGNKHIMLWEWHSVSFADYGELNGLGDATLEAHAAAFLYAQGYRFALDTSAATAALGVYSISNAGAMALTGGAAGTITQATCSPMMKIITGITGSGYQYGISPNTGGGYVISYPVPAFAAVNVKFPAGFEVMIVGANSGRQVFIRLVTVAQGAFKGIRADKEAVLGNVRDLY